MGGRLGGRRGPRVTAAGGRPKLACPDAKSQGGGGRRANHRLLRHQRRRGCPASAAPTHRRNGPARLGGGRPQESNLPAMRHANGPGRLPPHTSTQQHRCVQAGSASAAMADAAEGSGVRGASTQSDPPGGPLSWPQKYCPAGERHRGDPPHYLPLATLLPELVLQKLYSHPRRPATERLQTIPSRPKRRTGEREAGAAAGLAATAHSAKLNPGGRHQARHASALTPHSGMPDGWAAGRRERQGLIPTTPALARDEASPGERTTCKDRERPESAGTRRLHTTSSWRPSTRTRVGILPELMKASRGAMRPDIPSPPCHRVS